MRAPGFWWADVPSRSAWLLKPLGALYGHVTRWRMTWHGARPDIPVICVGNFVVGGAGKTPAAIAIARMLIARGETVFFLSRGHGGMRRGPAGKPLLVDPRWHSAADVGDEPLLLARVAPTIVTRDRATGAAEAARRGAGVIVMDDGMQNPSIEKDCVFAVVDGATGSGNGLCFPAGPLRAPVEAQLPLVDALIVIGEMGAGRGVARLAQSAGKPVLRARLTADCAIAATLDGVRVFAFAGIGRPEKFFEMLESCGAVVSGTRAFSDHHIFTAADCAELADAAAAIPAQLVTTEKDAVRLPRNIPAIVLPVSLTFADPRRAAALLGKAMAHKGRKEASP